MAHDPVVFISSTSDDLKKHREQAAKAAIASGFSPRMMEYFPASEVPEALPVLDRARAWWLRRDRWGWRCGN